MARLAVAGVLLALALTPGTALSQPGSQSDSRVGAPPIPKTPIPAPPVMERTQVVARDAYRQPSYGYQLPGQWMSAPYFMPNYRVYRLPRPATGFGWSRYHDDVVLTDRYGRVYDWRDNVDWRRDRRHRRYDGPLHPHWYPADAEGRYGWMEGPTITTTTVTQGKPVVTETVRYVTEYVTVPVRRTKYVKRGKYVQAVERLHEM